MAAPDYALPQRQNARRRRPRGKKSEEVLTASTSSRKRPLSPQEETAKRGESRERASAQRITQQRVGDKAEDYNVALGGGGDPASSELGEDLQVHRSLAIKGQKFEYLDHTADVQCHAWGSNLEEAFANAGLSMYNYMTPISGIKVDESLSRSFHAEGHDIQSLLFNFLDELLFIFHTEFFVACELEVTKIDKTNWTIDARGKGGRFSREIHECGTEVKAITYSAMQIHERPSEAEIFVIVDI